MKIGSNKGNRITGYRASRPDVKTEHIISLYDSGMYSNEIAEKLGMTTNSITARIRKAGHARRINGGKRPVDPDIKISKRLASAARNRARDGNYPCNITFEDIPIPAVCPLLGIPLTSGTPTHKDNAPSIDKIIPSKGMLRAMSGS
jgi:hypothetical protein